MKIPKHWSKARLSDLLILRKGKKPDRLSVKKFMDSVPYLDIQAVEKGIITQYADMYSTVISDLNDVFIVADGSRSGLVGKGAVGAVGSTLCCITPLGINNIFLYYFLRLKYIELNGNTTGVSIPHLNYDYFLNLELPFPGIEEQQRIVTELDNQLMVLQNDFTNAEQELSKLSDFKKSLLNEAVFGKLTSPNPKKLDTQTGLPSSWRLTTIEQLATFIGSGTTPSGGSTNYHPTGVPFLRSQNVYPNELRLKDVVYISQEMHDQMKRTHIQPKDVLLNITGASIGRSAYVPENFGSANVNQHVCIIRTNDQILPEYLSLFLNSPIAQDNINNLQKGVTRQGLNYDQIRSIVINLPPIEEQIQIVQQLDIQGQTIGELENEHSNKMNNVDSLENAILQMAFEGKLSRYENGDSQSALIFEKAGFLKEKELEKLQKAKLTQATKSPQVKAKLDLKGLQLFIEKNFLDSSFTVNELSTALNIENEYELFNDLLFKLLQDKVTDADPEPFLEAKFDKKISSKPLMLNVNETTTA
ncbi:restriction endonuclease subunit S [Pedobacter panaciterrae]